MVGFLLSIIIIALYEKGINFEKFDIFKVLYLILLIFSIIILVFVSVIGGLLEAKPITFNGILYLIIFSITISFLYIAINRDAYSKEETKIISENRYYKIPKFLLKMSISFLLGIASMIPFIFIMGVIPFPNEVKYESIKFFRQFLSFFTILGRWEILYLIIFSTIIPYILIFIANVNWKSEYLTYSQWSSILNLIDPMGSILFTVILLRAYFPLELLIITIFLLVITIILRYAHETKNLVRAYLLITVKKGTFKPLILRILKYYGITKISALIGNYDILVEVKINSIKDLYFLVDKRLKPINEIKNIEILFINRIELLSN